jgi:uncharacterized lipoprotein YddW (UPF0748 family)
MTATAHSLEGRRSHAQAHTAMRALLSQGQSVWLDDLGRGMTRSGKLDELVADRLRRMTSNPTIFEHSITASSDYDEAIAQWDG